MTMGPEDSDTKEEPDEPAAVTPREGGRDAPGAVARAKGIAAGALVAGKDAWARLGSAGRSAVQSDAARRIAALADKTAEQTKRATVSAATASRSGLVRAAQIGRENVLPELERTGAQFRERTRPERLKRDYIESLMRLHERVLDRSMERLFFVPTAAPVALEGLTIVGTHREQGHDYRPTPYYIFEWALSAIDFDLARLSFVDYGAGKGRVLLLAAQHGFKAVGGIEFAEELHDDAMMNIAQFPRSRMICRNVECILEDAANVGCLDGEAVHYFFNPFSREVFAEVLASIVASYRANPRRMYLVLVEPIALDLVEKSNIFQRLALPPAQRLRGKLFSPYEIAVYRTLA